MIVPPERRNPWPICSTNSCRLTAYRSTANDCQPEGYALSKCCRVGGAAGSERLMTRHHRGVQTPVSGLFSGALPRSPYRSQGGRRDRLDGQGKVRELARLLPAGVCHRAWAVETSMRRFFGAGRAVVPKSLARELLPVMMAPHFQPGAGRQLDSHRLGSDRERSVFCIVP